MAVPYTFAGATSSIPLSQLDTNFASTITLGNTAIQLGNTVTTLNNMTLANVTISSGNVTITNVTVTTANVTVGNITTLTGTSATYTNIASGNVTITGGTLNNVAIGGTTAASGAFTTLSASGAFSLTGDQVQISEGGTGQTTANAAFNALAPSQTGNSGKYLKTDGTDTSWDAIDINTADITGTLPILNGGTGQTTANAAFNALAPSQTSQSGKYLKTDGTNASWDALDISTADITGTLPIANGGSGQTTANAALNAFLPSQTSQSGKYLKTDGTNASWDQLDISTADITGTLPVANGGTNATATPTAGAVAYGTGTAYAFTSAGSSGQVLTSGGAGAPTWSSLSSIGVTTFSAGTTGFTPSTATSGAVTLAGTLATTNGGTGLTSFTANRVFYSSSTSAIGSSANLTFDGTTLTANALTTTSTVTINGGTANGVAYLNGSKVLTTGSALTFDGSKLLVGSNTAGYGTLNVARDTTTPYASLTVTDEANAANTVGIYLRQSGASAAGISTAGAPLAFYLGGAGASEAMRLTSTGLGIGTSSPLYPLHVVTSSISVAAFRNSGAANTQIIVGNTAADLQIRTLASGDAIIYSDTGKYLALGSNGGTERMRITSAGDVGIGTTSPASKLDVVGAARLTADVASVSLYTGAGWRHTGSSGLYIDANFGGAANSVFIRNGSGLATQLTLDGSGNIGLGVTPSAWGGSYRALQVGSASSLYNIGANTIVGNNAYNDGTNSRYITSSYASLYAQNSSGQHLWYTAASGTAGNIITFTQAMTLFASGALWVGSSSEITGGQGFLGLNGASGSGAGPSIGFSQNGTFLGSIGQQSRISGSGTSQDIFIQSQGASNNIGMNASPSGAYIYFQTQGTERARITSGGYFKASNSGSYVGSTGSYHELVSNDASNGVAVVESTNASYASYALVVGAARNTTNNSFYAIGYYNRGAAAYRFQVADSGNVTNTNGSYGTISDAKMKTDIVDAGSQWADIKAVRFRKFKMKDDPEQIVQLGVVAQELEQTSPGLVEEHKDTDKDGNDLGTTTKSVKTSVLLMKAAVALQEAMARIEQLEAKVAALEAK